MKTSSFVTWSALALSVLAFTGCFKVTGGGKFLMADGSGITDPDGNVLVDLGGKECTFAFTAQEKEKGESTDDFVPAKGHFVLVNRQAGITLTATLNETINSQYQSLAPDTVSYWGVAGSLKIGNAKPVDVTGFQLTISTPEDGPASVFFAGDASGLGFFIMGDLENGNVTIHAE